MHERVGPDEVGGLTPPASGSTSQCEPAGVDREPANEVDRRALIIHPSIRLGIEQNVRSDPWRHRRRYLDE